MTDTPRTEAGRALSDKAQSLWWQPNPLAGANAMQSAQLEVRAAVLAIEAEATTPDADWEALYVAESERYARLSNEHAKCRATPAGKLDAHFSLAPDASAEEWRGAYFALATIAQAQLDECRARLQRIEAAARGLDLRPDRAITDGNAIAALREALDPEMVR